MGIINAKLFAAVGNLAASAKRRRDSEHKEFLEFYRQLVETLPAEVCTIFGNMGSVEVLDGGKNRHSCGIELTATDFIWWKHKIESEGCTFARGTNAVKADMLARMSKGAEASRLTPTERKELVSLLETATAK